MITAMLKPSNSRNWCTSLTDGRVADKIASVWIPIAMKNYVKSDISAFGFSSSPCFLFFLLLIFFCLSFSWRQKASKVSVFLNIICFLPQRDIRIKVFKLSHRYSNRISCKNILADEVNFKLQVLLQWRKK